MNQDPIIPEAPQTPQINPMQPIDQNPAAAATPSFNPTSTMPQAPAMTINPPTPATTPEAAALDVPTIDPTLLQQAIADVPEGVDAPATPAAIPVDNPIPTPAPEATPTPVDYQQTSPFTTATPTASFSPEQPPVAPTGVDAQAASAVNPNPQIVPNIEEPNKQPPSVAFNDPASMPDKQDSKKNIDLSKLTDKIKKNPLVFIIVGGLIVIVSLVLILAFAVK